MTRLSQQHYPEAFEKCAAGLSVLASNDDVQDCLQALEEKALPLASSSDCSQVAVALAATLPASTAHALAFQKQNQLGCKNH